jgi:hypothetical protein
MACMARKVIVKFEMVVKDGIVSVEFIRFRGRGRGRGRGEGEVALGFLRDYRYDKVKRVCLTTFYNYSTYKAMRRDQLKKRW